jgi:ribosomal protein S18 acetylase RimI-like enzyme
MLKFTTVCKNHINDMKLLADANRNSISFMTRKKFEEIVDQQRAFVSLFDDTVIGFVVFRHRKLDLQTTLSEICVQHKYRGQGIGTDLIQLLIRDCNQKKRDFIQLKCPIDLPANKFYEHLGFDLHMTEDGRKRKLNVWRLAIAARRVGIE